MNTAVEVIHIPSADKTSTQVKALELKLENARLHNEIRNLKKQLSTANTKMNVLYGRMEDCQNILERYMKEQADNARDSQVKNQWLLRIVKSKKDRFGQNAI